MMKMWKGLTMALLGISLGGVMSISSLKAGEHAGKEHAGQEHAGKKHKKGIHVSAKDIKETINAYIKEDTNLKGGDFLIYDNDLKKTWRLKFVKIHDPVRVINKKTYFACMDFKEIEGTNVLDIDFWLEVAPEEENQLKVTDIKIHKLNGKPRFTYKKDKPVTVK